ncbi:hypothetical protein JNUCC64_28860 [Streptomyces sp. JNUCC 64]
MADPAEVPDEIESLLTDLSALPFETVAELPDSALGCALRRLHEAARTPDRMFASQYQDSL